MDKSLVLQAINGYLAVTSVAAIYIFLRYLYLHRDLPYQELRPAIVLISLFLGELVLRAPQFGARTLANMGMHISQPNLPLVIGGLVVEGVFLCIIRVFSPEKWGFWPWFVTFMVSTVVVGGSFLLVQWS